MATRTVLTYNDYEALPTDGWRYEIHDGGLSVNPAPSPRHQQVSGNLFFVLRGHVESRGLGRVLYASINVEVGKHVHSRSWVGSASGIGAGRRRSRWAQGPPTLRASWRRRPRDRYVQGSRSVTRTRALGAAKGETTAFGPKRSTRP